MKRLKSGLGWGFAVAGFALIFAFDPLLGGGLVASPLLLRG